MIDLKNFHLRDSAFLAAVISPLFLGSSHAADLLVGSVPVPGLDWTRLYAGIHAGLGEGRAVHMVGGLATPASNALRGEVVGIYGGYDRHLVNGTVLGVDADLSWNGYAGSGRVTLCACEFVDVSTELEWTAALRARAGYAFGPFLPYVAAGVAVARVESVYDHSTSGATARQDTKAGWTAGAGVDYAFRDNMVFRAEYRYSEFGREPGVASTDGGQEPKRITTDELRLGVAFVF